MTANMYDEQQIVIVYSQGRHFEMQERIFGKTISPKSK